MEINPTGQPITDDDAELHARRVEISDGRYLIFFTFGDQPEEPEQEKENV